MEEQIRFHGGCHGCTMQQKNGIGFCTGCKFFEMNHDLPNLNDESNKRDDDLEEVRKRARTEALGLIPTPKVETKSVPFLGDKVSLAEQLEIAVDEEDYERAAELRDLIAEDKPYRDALNKAINSGNYEEAARIREANKKGFFGRLGDKFFS